MWKETNAIVGASDVGCLSVVPFCYPSTYKYMETRDGNLVVKSTLTVNLNHATSEQP